MSTGTVVNDMTACPVCGRRHCHRCGRDLEERMGVYRFAFAGVQVTRIPGLACIDCAALPDLPEGAQCPIPAATWADGFGVWHARVTTTPDAPQVALAAIVHELEIRGDLYDHDASMIGVTLADPKLYTYGPDTAVYVETLEETTTP